MYFKNIIVFFICSTNFYLYMVPIGKNLSTNSHLLYNQTVLLNIIYQSNSTILLTHDILSYSLLLFYQLI